MADTLIAGTTLIEKESRSIGDIPISGIVEWDDSVPGTPTLPEGFLECDGSTIVDSLSPINGQTLPNLNTRYWNANGAKFHAATPDISDIVYDSTTGQMDHTGTGARGFASVELPHGAVVTAVVVYSNVTTEIFSLKSNTNDGTADLITHATESLNTPDTSITSATIDNENRTYFLVTDPMDGTDAIFSAKITYTPRNKFVMRVR